MITRELSIIVPIYKVEKYLNRCIDSILNQTFLDYEMILVDDGSPDNCYQICEEYVEKDNRIKVIHKENGGLASARNAGMRIAEGQFLLFIDSDDTIEPDFCEIMLNAIKENENAWVLCAFSHVFPDSAKYRGIEAENNTLDYFDVYKSGLSGFAWNKIYSHKIIQDNKLRFDESLVIAEDVDFTARYFSYTNDIRYISKPIYNYYCNDGSLLQRYYPNLFELRLKPFAARLPLIKKEEMEEYCDIFLYYFIHFFDVVFDERCNWSFFKKLKYNQKMIKTEEFNICVSNASDKVTGKKLHYLLRKQNYYLYYLYQKLARIKNKLAHCKMRLKQ